MALLILALAGGLAFANGANDNCKGVATLVGFGAVTPRGALLWAAVTTAAGSAVGFLLAHGLLETFRAGSVAGGEALPPVFYAAVLSGAVAWVLFATATGLPVSTTHAITGGLVGAGIWHVGAAQIAWPALGVRFALPLLCGPLLSLALVWVAARPLVRLAERWVPRCICVVEQPEVVVLAGGAAAAAPRFAVVVDRVENCAVHGALASARGGALADTLHWSTAGLVGFARGWNDTPKIAALALVALPPASGTGLAFAGLTVAMAAGGLLAGRKVLTTLAHRITAMPLGQSLAASGVSSLLVSLASWQGLPVSTTHVSTGAIVGAGLRLDPSRVRWRTVREIALSWVVTLPAAALVALLALALLGSRG